jgi:hypothetical protein
LPFFISAQYTLCENRKIERPKSFSSRGGHRELREFKEFKGHRGSGAGRLRELKEFGEQDSQEGQGRQVV